MSDVVSPDEATSRARGDGSAPRGVPGAPAPDGEPTRAVALVERIAAALGGHASVRAVYGEPITHGDVTIVPVARAALGFGGGAGGGWKSADGTTAQAGPGAGATEGGDGGGGGGGAHVRPLGYVEIAHGRSTWHPIRPSVPDGRALAAGVALGLLAAAAIRGLRRG
ncbi:spore germination protein GerW family protein [Isoptericola variabilis]|uniref:Sporulation protein YtfJ n=1 Tax=Isoptericola variabilis (strain 225) TaxID=743718 RepID=F6FUL0_ISOV2|nr:spore germination protein GerW family protein [Isoptericola variabilis]AEG45437.1 Sporulation protein YtfJ [Isoptericola variabilis 225]TWH31541.1 sporulation protein YtfJ [Isoptericola variabilis J7]